MIHRRRMKMPDGRLIEPSPDPLALFLAVHQPALYVTLPPMARPRGTNKSSSAERDYSTQSFDIRKLIHRLDSEPASGLDIATVAQQAARVILDIRYSKVTGQSINRWDTAKNLIYISNTKDELSPDGPGLHFEASRKRPGCPVCDRQSAA